MKRWLVIEPEADLRETYRWDEAQRAGLGEEFLLSVEASLNEIQRRPESFQLVGGRMRRAAVRRFQYGVFYVIETETTNVLAVLHGGRNPRVWKRRGGGRRV